MLGCFIFYFTYVFSLIFHNITNINGTSRRDLYFKLSIFQEVSKMACSKFVCGVYPMDEVGFLECSISIHNIEIGLF